MTPITIATKSIAGQALLYWRRRYTSTGEMKMSMRSSQNDGCAGAVAIAAPVSVMAGGGMEGGPGGAGGEGGGGGGGGGAGRGGAPRAAQVGGGGGERGPSSVMIRH